MDKDLELLHQKIDFLTEQVMETKKRQQEFDELKKELTLIGSDVYGAAVEELEDVAPYFTTEDMIFLVKKVLRNTKTLTELFDQLESVKSFMQDAAPLTKDMFDSSLLALDDLEKKGYFNFLKAAFGIVDNIVTTYSEEDVKQLGENVVLILDTVRQLTQPEIMTTLQNVLKIYQNLDMEPVKEVSLFGLVKELNDPHVRKGLLTGVTLLKNMAQNFEQTNN